jgi:hypothetical protein
MLDWVCLTHNFKLFLNRFIINIMHITQQTKSNISILLYLIISYSFPSIKFSFNFFKQVRETKNLRTVLTFFFLGNFRAEWVFTAKRVLDFLVLLVFFGFLCLPL